MAKLLGKVVGKATDMPRVPDYSLPIPFARVGIEVEVENWDGKELSSPLWESKEDHSLRGISREFVTTNDGLIGRDITEAIKSMCEECTQRKYSCGYPRAGIHIHLDVTNLDMDRGDLQRLAANYLIIEHIMFAFAGDWRNYCCYTVPVTKIGADAPYLGRAIYNDTISNGEFVDILSDCSKYQALNFETITRYGTVEFRHLPTTFDEARIRTWICMILALKKYSMEHTEYPLHTLSRLGPHEYVKDILGEQIYLQVANFVDAAQIWSAVDTAQLLMAHGGKVKTSSAWSRMSMEDSPIIAEKKIKIEEYRASRARK